MDTVNLFSAENHEGEGRRGSCLGSTATLMFIYDVAPGERQSPYHYEYEEEWLLVVDGTLVLRTPDGEQTSSAETWSASRPVPPERTSSSTGASRQQGR